MIRSALVTLVLLLALGAATATGTPCTAVGDIRTVAGNGIEGHTGDGGPAVDAEIGHPRGIAPAPGGGFVFTEPFNHMVRRVWPDGTIRTIAGTGTPGSGGDQGPATQAQLDLPHGVAYTPEGLLIADDVNHRIRLVAADGTITTVAGTGRFGFSGEGGPAAAAEISGPRGVAALPDGGYLIPDTDNERIRRVAPDGTITTVAGSGEKGFGGDDGPALAAKLQAPFAAVPTPDGGFLIADADNNRIRRVGPTGTITTVAGNGGRGYGGDHGPATAATLNDPHAVVSLPDGGFLIADTFNNRIRRVSSTGTITTVAGTGSAGFAGDNGPADAAELNLPKALAVLPDATGFLVGDSANDRVRLVTIDLRPPFTVKVTASALRSRTGRSVVLRLTTSLPATIRLQVRRAGKLVLGVKALRPAGTASIAFGKRLQPGRYALAVLAQSADGRTRSARGSLTVSR